MAYWTALLLLLLFLSNWLQGQGQTGTSLIDAYSPTSVLSSPATVLGTTVVLVCRVGGVASGTQLSYTWTCPNGPCDVGEGNNPNRKTYGDRMVLNMLTSRDGGTYTCLVREGQDVVYESSFTLNVQGGTVLSSYNRLIPNNAIIFDNGNTDDDDTNVGDILPPDGSSSVAVIDCSTDNPTQPLTWTDGAGQPVPTSPNLTVYQTTNGSSAALHIDTTDTSIFTNGRYQCDGGMERTVNIYINQEGAVIPTPQLLGLHINGSVARFLLGPDTPARSERYISSLERTDLGVPLEVEFEETQSSGTDGDAIDRHVSAPGAVYNIEIWSINGASFSYDPVVASTTLLLETAPSVPRLLSVTRILSDGFELNWLPPREPNGRPWYEIEYGTDDTNFTTVDTGSGDTHYNLTGLQQNTTYYIRVVAVNYFTFNGRRIKGNESETLTMTLASQPTNSTTAPPPTDMPSSGSSDGTIDLLPIIIPASVVAAFLLLLVVLLVLVTVCCMSQRRRGRQKRSKENHLYDYVTASVGYSSPAGGEDKDGYAVIGKDSSEKNGHTLIMSNKASIKDVSGRERKSTVVESSTEGQGQSDLTYYNTVTGSELYQNKQTVDEADEEMRGQQRPLVYSNAGKKGGSAENAAAVPTTRTPRPPSQDYATIPDKEPEEGLYDTAEEVDTQATPPTADYASTVEPGQQGADDTEQPPPVPAFDPEILYTQPDKTSKAKDIGYKNVPRTLGHGIVGDYDSVDMPHAGTEKQPKVPIPTTAHHEAPDFGYDTVPEASGPVAEGGYEAIDIPHTKTAAAREAEARKLPDKPTAPRPGQPTSSISETSSSQNYTTIPDKESEEGLYNTADHTPSQEADIQATLPTADYASIVKPGQEGADDTKHPPPVPAFDPEILYTQPDKTSNAKDGGYETIPDTLGSATAEGDYESVDMPHAGTEKQPKVPSPTTAHHEAPDFGYDTVPEASGPVAEGGYEAVDIPRTKTAAAL